MPAKPTFPNAVWDGTTANPWRGHSTFVDPQQDDWNRIVAELQETQRVVLGVSLVGSPLHQAEASEPIAKGRMVAFTLDGRLRLADSADSAIAGMTIEDIGLGAQGSYIRRGRVSALDWSDIAGTELLSAGATYFVSEAGRISETPPNTGYLIRAGQAQSPNDFDLDLGPSVRL
jgi:hypothetical protein